MARFAFISDIHGNLPALEAVLAAIDRQGVDATVCLGDVVGYGPHPGECLDRLDARGIFSVQGNHELSVIDELEASRFNPAARVALRYTRERLTDEQRARVQSMPPSADLDDVIVTHASPIHDDNGSDYVHDQTMAALAFGACRAHCLLLGHTHIPIAFGTPDTGFAAVEPQDVRVAFLPHGLPLRLDPRYRYILNPGSVGQPRDGNPDASYGVLDTVARTFTVHRIAYDVERTQRAMVEAGLPNFLAHRLRLGA